MQTQTTIEAVERTPSGALKITFQGGSIAGAKDPAVIATAEAVAAQVSPNPVQITVHRLSDDRLLVTDMEELAAPYALGGEPEPEDVAKTEAIAPGSDPTGEQTLEEALAVAMSLPNEVILLDLQRRLGL